jgi:bifunctional non-homologous end joining protein LigD
MPLKEYQRKRHFDKTPEPRGREGAKSATRTLSFVIQKHAASHLHYDFRLEIDGVLKSWAVPKGPSLDPADKSLAIQVEDHPVEYGTFEGTIPQGQYGGGTVMLWDHGTWILDPIAGTKPDPLEAWEAGKLHFTLHGKKLKGSWILVRMRPRRPGDKPQWLLRKVDDEYARPHDEYDVRAEEDRSVTTKRTMDQITHAADRTWQSHRASSNGKHKTSRSTRGGTGGSSASGARGASPKLDPSSIPNSKSSPQPKTLTPQLCTLVDHAPEGDDWIHEVKFDGYRILAHIKSNKARLISRNDKDWTTKFADLAHAIEKLNLPDAILDGELVAMNDNGISSFQALQSQLKGGGHGLIYYAFDLPWLSGYDLRACTLEDRRAALKSLLDSAGPLTKNSRVRFSEAIRGQGPDVYANACRLGTEGIVSKRLDSPYRGDRGRDWVKTKCTLRQEMVIAGWTDPQRSRTALGALLLGYYRSGKLQYAGKVGTGFDVKTLKDLLKRLRSLERKTPAFENPPRGAEAARAHWAEPKLVAEIEFTEWTTEGNLRHPAFTGLREDKDPMQVVRETKSEPKGASPRSPTLKQARRRQVQSPSDDGKVESTTVLGIPISHPDKVLYPDHNITKQSLAEYYAAIAERMLPTIAGRPLMLVRCPSGQQSTCFHQKNWDDELPAAAHGVKIKESSTTNRYIVVDKPAGLVWLVQRGVLEIHNWGSTEKDLDHPDRLIFDLDPDPDIPWRDVVAGAVLIRDTLDELGLESFAKTTGGKGLHIIAPLQPKADWAQVKQFVMGLAQSIAQKEPDKYVANMSKAKRTGKIYIDYLRNARGATSVAAYSTRARPGAPVSVPLSWKELTAMKSRPDFSTQDAIARTKQADPWAGMSKVRQSIKP